MRSTTTKDVRTACTYDCPDACGLIARHSEDGLRLAGDPDHPITRGFLCQRIRRHPDRLAAQDRLRTPLLREGGSFRQASWDEALDVAAQKLSAALEGSGAPSVVAISGGGTLGLSKRLVSHFFCSLGPVTTVGGGLCGEAGQAAQVADFGDAACHDYTDLDRASAVVLWGKNPAATGVHLVPFLTAARKRGAPVVLVEPRHTESSGQATWRLSVRPSGDGFLALAVVRRLHDRGAIDDAMKQRVHNWSDFERFLSSKELVATRSAALAGVSMEEVDRLAAIYVDDRPVATWIGWGLQRRLSGGRNVRCIDALALLSGNVGVAGGGANFTSTRSRGLDKSPFAAPSGRRVRAATIGRDLEALADPEARFVYLAASNPVTQSPDSAATARALRSAGFVVVADAFMTDTANAADLVLPVRLMLEEDDVVGSYQHHHVAVVRAATEPPEGTRSDGWIVRELGRRLGRDADPLLEDPEGALARMTAPWFEGHEPTVRRNPFQEPVPHQMRFATPSGRATLLTELPALVPEEAGYPLTFLSASARGWQTSQLPEARQVGPADCWVHPDDAAGLGSGEAARLESPLGSMPVVVRLDSRMGRELAVVHRGGWLRNDRCVNRLVEARETDLGGGAAFYDQRVRLVPE